MRWLKLFDADLVTQVHGARRIGGVSLLRVATNGYNVSIEKPLVVGHDHTLHRLL